MNISFYGTFQSVSSTDAMELCRQLGAAPSILDIQQMDTKTDISICGLETPRDKLKLLKNWSRQQGIPVVSLTWLLDSIDAYMVKDCQGYQLFNKK
jgi:hypothetical protein